MTAWSLLDACCVASSNESVREWLFQTGRSTQNPSRGDFERNGDFSPTDNKKPRQEVAFGEGVQVKG